MSFQKNAGTLETKKRRIMRTLKINEISAVDRPAQEGARAVIMKRAEETPSTDSTPETEKRGVDYVDVLTETADGHQHGIRVVQGDNGAGLILSYAGSGDGDHHDHQIVKDADGNWVIGHNSGHTHEIDQEAMNNAVMTFMTKGTVAAPDETAALEAGDASIVGTEGELNMADTNQALDEMTKRAERAEAISNMSADVRKHFDGLDADAQNAFLEMDETARGDVAKSAAEANAVVFKAADGTEYRKSDDPRMVALARQNDMLAEGIAKAAAANAEAEVVAIAKSLEHLPGDLETRTALVKSVNLIEDETQREAAMTALKSQNDALATAFKSVGTTGAAAPASGSESQLDELAKAHAADKGVSFEKAMSAVLATPEGAALYNQSLN